MQDSKVKRLFQICSINLKISWIYNLGACILLLLIIPLLFDIENTDIKSASKICEEFVSLLGIVLLVPVFKPEQQDNINELIETKPLSKIVIYIIRIVVSVLLLFLLITAFVLTLKFLGGNFDTMKFILGTFATAFFLGSIGLFINSVVNVTLVGYMLSIGVWIYELSNKIKLIGCKLNMISLFRDSFVEKCYIFASGVIIIILSLNIYYIRRSKKGCYN